AGNDLLQFGVAESLHRDLPSNWGTERSAPPVGCPKVAPSGIPRSRDSDPVSCPAAASSALMLPPQAETGVLPENLLFNRPAGGPALPMRDRHRIRPLGGKQ